MMRSTRWIVAHTHLQSQRRRQQATSDTVLGGSSSSDGSCLALEVLQSILNEQVDLCMVGQFGGWLLVVQQLHLAEQCNH